MKTILLVDDDPLVLELYRKKLASGGYNVRTANDGMEAVKLLATLKPDFVVLDLMMPRLTGTEVLRFIRSNPALAKVPVAALTNAFMSEQARAVSSLGVERAIVKGDCTPGKMLEIANQVLSEPSNPKPAVTALPKGNTTRVEKPAPRPAPALDPTVNTTLLINEARASFMSRVPKEFTDLRSISVGFAQDPAAASRSGNLQELYRQIHLLASAAAVARCQYVALLAGALEALLFELNEKPQFITNSTSRTVAGAVEFLGMVIEHAEATQPPEPIVGEVLAVDDDPLANRIALAAMSRTSLTARAIENPLSALELMQTRHFDLILLDIEMPQMNGFELCQKLRAIPGYEQTPVIYVTSHADFDNRVKSIGLGAQDVIAKPIFPLELAVKAVQHLIKGRLTPMPVNQSA